MRDSQREFARAVDDALENNGILIAEAGTGTGKTFAYLVPALLSGLKVLISTGTKTLQDQLFKRDLPAIRDALAVPVEVALLKGRANYLCLYHLARNAREGRFASREETRDFHVIQRFAKHTLTGDRAELATLPENASAWMHATSTRENCLGSQCPDYKTCFVMQARKAALNADVVVINHHLFFADVMLREEGIADLLPRANAVIFDEAHQLPETARMFLGESVSTSQLIELARDTRVAQAQHARDAPQLTQAADDLERRARDLRLAVRAPIGRVRDKELLAERDFAEALQRLEAQTHALGEVLDAHAERDPELAQLARRAGDVADRLSRWHGADEAGLVRWAEANRLSLTLYATPLDVGRRFAAEIEDRPQAWIFTSATLAVGEDFSLYRDEVGLAASDRAHAQRWPSPFDFASQALLYAPRDMPDPNDPGYSRAVIEASVPLIEASGGRAFVLCTSLRAMDEIHAGLETAVAERGLTLPLIKQGQGAKNELLERFRRAGNAVLVGSLTFWEGVDVKGDALSLVIIDRLPFQVPDDPVLQARIEAMKAEGRNAFTEYQLPRAIITLKQGAGRLIRDESERGVLTICDPRLVTKPYGKRILASLPPMRRTRELDDVRAFFASDERNTETAVSQA